MTERERFIQTLTFGKPDRAFYFFGKPRKSTLDAWYLQGLPRMSDAGDYGAPRNFYEFSEQDRLDWGLPINVGPLPAFEVRILEENEHGRIWTDGNGITMHDAGAALKTPGFNTRSYISHPVENRDDWQRIRKRFDPDTPGRYPANWDHRAAKLRQRDWPVMVALPSMYWKARDWVGFEELAMLFYDDPALVHDMMEHTTVFIMEVLRRAVHDAHIDCVMFGEDMAYKHASMISPTMFKEFMLPRYARLAQFFKDQGVPVVMVDCDGHISQLLPFWLEAGMDGTYPCEIAALNDPIAYRKQYGKNISIFGAIDKRAIRSREQTYQEVMSKIPWLLQEGGYLPCIDHAVPPDVPLRSYLYMIELIKAIAEGRRIPQPQDRLKIEDRLGPIQRMWSAD